MQPDLQLPDKPGALTQPAENPFLKIEKHLIEKNMMFLT